MNYEECSAILNQINSFLEENQWMDFEVCIMNGGKIVLSGSLDELDEELIEISFIQPYMCSCLMSFSYDDGQFISLVQGEEAYRINTKYNVDKGNSIFTLNIDGENKYFIIAKKVEVKFADFK